MSTIVDWPALNRSEIRLSSSSSFHLSRSRAFSGALGRSPALSGVLWRSAASVICMRMRPKLASSGFFRETRAPSPPLGRSRVRRLPRAFPRSTRVAAPGRGLGRAGARADRGGQATACQRSPLPGDPAEGGGVRGRNNTANQDVDG